MSAKLGLNLIDMIDRHARHPGAHPALIMNDETVTWFDFNKKVNQVANALIANGLKKGDKVSFLALNSISAVAVLFGTMRAGGVIIPISAMLTPDLICTFLQDSSSTFFFVDQMLKPIVDKIGKKMEQTSVKKKIGIGFQDDGWIPFEKFIKNSSADLPNVVLYDDDEANIIYSSGTTGVPKGIIHTHRFRTMFCFSMTIESRIDNTSRVIFATPLFTNATWVMLLPVILVGACGILMPSFSPEAFLEIAEKKKGTHSFMVPTQFQKVLDVPNFDKFDLSGIRILMTGGGAMHITLKQKLIEKFRGRFMELYGLTEGVGTTLSPEEMLTKTDSIGTPIVGTEIRIIDDEGHEVKSGEPGEIVGTGGSLMKGYHNRPEASAEILWYDERGRMYLKTGDVGRFDKDGFLYLVDRKKDMIVSGGLNIYPSDIEGVLLEHPDIEEAAVIGIPDMKWGETPMAIIVKKGTSAIEGEELKSWANERLANPQRISKLVFREKGLPRNALGKVLKKDLRDEYVGAEKK